MARYFFLFTSLLMIHLQANSQQNKSWKYFELDQLSVKNAGSEGSYLQFINEASLSMGLYELRKDSRDQQRPHERDEIYYVTKGTAKLKVVDDTIAVHPGSIVYVKAEAGHRFVDISEDLQVLVIFSNSEPSSTDPDWLAFELSDLPKKRKPDENVWNQFLDVGTMRMGLYMLPKALDGDQTLTHKVDEINIVVDGRSSFVAGNDSLEVKPGSVFYVEGGTEHYFQDIQEGQIDILILFHKK